MPELGHRVIDFQFFETFLKSEVVSVCNLVDCSLPDSSFHEILQARILEWVAIAFSRGLNPGLLNCRQMLYPLSHHGSQKSQMAFQSSYTISQSALKSVHVFTWKKCLCGIRVRFKLNLLELSSSLLLLSHLPSTFCLPFSLPSFLPPASPHPLLSSLLFLLSSFLCMNGIVIEGMPLWT